MTYRAQTSGRSLGDLAIERVELAILRNESENEGGRKEGIEKTEPERLFSRLAHNSSSTEQDKFIKRELREMRARTSRQRWL